MVQDWGSLCRYIRSSDNLDLCSKVCEIFFGSEDDPDSRFVQLEDCGHVLEVTSVDTWMDQSDFPTRREVDIQLKSCPKCTVKGHSPTEKTRRVFGDNKLRRRGKQRSATY